MSYQALARKYRPQRFSDIVGQETVVRTLQNAIEQNRIHHAYLFSGVRRYLMASQKMTMKTRMETVPVTMHMKMKRASTCPATLEARSGHSGKSESIIAADAPCES